MAATTKSAIALVRSVVMARTLAKVRTESGAGLRISRRVLQTRAVIRVLRERPLRAPEVAAARVSRAGRAGVTTGAGAAIVAARVAGSARRARVPASFLRSPGDGVASPIDDVTALFRPVARHIGGFAVLVSGQVTDVLRLLADRAPQFRSGLR